MVRKQRHLQAAAAALAMAALPFATSARAGELGHYGPAVADIRDYVMPAEPGVAFKLYTYYYTSQTFRNANGDKVSTIPLPGGGTVNVDVGVDIYVIAPAVLWISDWEILGGHYGAYILPSFGNSSVGASLRTETGLGRGVDESSFGVGDLFVQPLWLGWNWEHWDLSTGYGFYAPIGKFDQGDADNVGLGFWTHQLQLAGAWYPWKERGTAVVGAFTYEFNQEVEDSDTVPGQRASFNLGVSQYLPLGQSGFLLELGALGYGQFQTTDDEGSDAFRGNVHDQLLGAGAQIGLTYLPWKAAATFKYTRDFAVEDRFEGDNFTLNFAAAF
jgi:hypothetical protein